MTGINFKLKTEHWVCTCDTYNYLTREKCLNCGMKRPIEIKERAKVRKIVKKNLKSRNLSQRQFMELKSKCRDCIGSKMCSIHVEMEKLIGKEIL